MKKISLLLWLVLIGFLPLLLFDLALFANWKIMVLLISWSILIYIEPLPAETTSGGKFFEKNYDRVRIAFAGWASLLAPLAEWVFFQTNNRYLTCTGILLIVLGISLRAFSIWILSEHYSPNIKINDQHRIIRKGPYKFLRHPIYMGSLLFYIGQALFLNASIGVLIAFTLMINAYSKRIALEEKILTEKFKQTYIDFQESTWKMIPLIY